MRFLLLLITTVFLFQPLEAEGAGDAKKTEVADTAAADYWPEEIPDYSEAVCREEDAMFESAEQYIEYLMGRPILGETAVVDADRLFRFVSRHNPDFDISIARAYITVGQRYGIPGDIALCQGIVETGWFRFTGGTKVTPEQHNYCGLGVVRLGERGHSFASVEEGVTAQIQHLYAYACKNPLPRGERLVDPRFRLVSRGIAPTWADLAGRWAANNRYARSILKLYVELEKFE